MLIYLFFYIKLLTKYFFINLFMKLVTKNYFKSLIVLYDVLLIKKE